jgi:non-ribosomal peptide synthetase component F
MVTQEAHDELKQKCDDLEAKYERTLVYIDYLQRHLFGKTTERHVPSPVNELQGSLFALEAPIETVIVEKEQITYERSKKVAVKHPGRKPLNEDLPREVIEVLHAEADPATMERIGEQVTEQLAMRPVQCYVKQYVYPKYLH